MALSRSPSLLASSERVPGRHFDEDRGEAVGIARDHQKAPTASPWVPPRSVRLSPPAVPGRRGGRAPGGRGQTSRRGRARPRFPSGRKMSCSSSSFGVIFRAMLRLDPGEDGGSASRLLAKKGAWRQRRVLRVPLGSRVAARKAATRHAPSVPVYTSGSSEVARERRRRSRRQRSGTRLACPSCLAGPRPCLP